MGLGDSAYTVASHVCLLGALLLLMWRLVSMMHNETPLMALGRGLVPGMAIFALGIIVERAYYVAARLLAPSGMDLWAEHPAPEVLSAMMFGTLYAMKGTIIFSLHPAAVARHRLCIELTGFVALWCSVAWVLY